MKRDADLTYVNLILATTAFAAGAVDIIGFSKLGGVFASAMTGNFALLTYHLAEGRYSSALGSVIALSGFLIGCVFGFTLRRGRPNRSAVRFLLCLELALLFVFAIAASVAGGLAAAAPGPLIALLAIGM